MSSQRLSSLLLLVLATALAPGCAEEAEGVNLPDAPEPVVIHTPLAAAEAAEHADDVALRTDGLTGTENMLMTGSTAAHRRSTLSARVSGVVKQVNVREGDRVKADDVLVVFDARDTVLQLKAANAAIGVARVGVDTARVEADRAEQLVKSKAIPSQQADLASAQYRAARAQLQQALVNKEMVEARLEDTEVKAPYDSVIIKRHANEGEYIMTMPPGPLVTLEEVGVIDVNVSVPASRLGEVAAGTPVRISVPSRKITRVGEITRLIPTMDPRTRTATAIIELEDPDASLIPGLFAEVRVIHAGAAAVPAPADAPSPAHEADAAPAPEVTP